MAGRYKTALVTGGAGFIGSHVVDALLKRGMKVHVVDDLSAGSRSVVDKRAKLHVLDISSDRLLPLMAKARPDLVVHAAAQVDVRASIEDPVGDAMTNVIGTLRVLQGTGHCGAKKLVYVSSGSAIYAADEPLPHGEGAAIGPMSPYAVSKFAAEQYVRASHVTSGLPYVILRLANVYGPRQGLSKEAGVVAVFTKRMLAGKEVIINGDGEQTRDLVYVGDVARAVMRAADRAATGTYNIGTCKRASINQVFRKLRDLTGADIAEVHAPAKAGEVIHSALRCALAKKELGWEPKVSLDDGLRKTVAWARKNG